MEAKKSLGGGPVRKLSTPPFSNVNNSGNNVVIQGGQRTVSNAASLSDNNNILEMNQGYEGDKIYG